MWLRVTACVMLLSSGFTAFTCNSHHNSSRSTLRGEIPEYVDVVSLLVTLGWTSVTLVTDSVTDCRLFLNELQANKISAMIAEHNISIITSTPIASDAYHTNGRFLVLAKFPFVERAFEQVADQATRSSHLGWLFFTEWVAVIDQESVTRLEHIARQYENVAAVVRQKDGGRSLWTMTRNMDKTRMAYVTSLPVITTTLSRQRIFPNRVYGLNGRTLRIVIKRRSYFIFKTKEGYRGSVMELLWELSHRLNFSYTLQEPPDNSWGQELDNGSWDGAIGMLTRKEVDMAVGSFSETPDRSSVADATTAFLYDNARLMFRTAKPSIEAWSFFLQPFQPTVYLVIAGVFIGVLLLLLCIDKCQKKEWQYDDLESLPQTTSVFWWVCDETESLLAALINRPFENDTRGRAGRALMCAWLLLSVLLAAYYGSGLTATLTVLDQAPPFTSMGELVHQDLYTWGVSSGTAKSSILRDSKHEVHQQFYQGVLRFAKSDPMVVSPDLEVQKEKVFGGHYVFFTGSSDLYDYWHAENCDIAMISETYFKTSKVFYLQKGSPYTKMISDEIGRMFEAGLITYWRRKWSPDKQQCARADRKSSGTVTGLVDIQSAFWLVGFGVGAATLALGLELLHLLVRRWFGVYAMVSPEELNLDLVRGRETQTVSQ